VDRDAPVRDALVVLTHRLARPGAERREVEAALLALIGRRDPARLLPLRAVRLARALRVPGGRAAEEAARKAGVLPFHADDVLERAGEALLSEVEPLLASPRRIRRTAGRSLAAIEARQDVDEAILRHVRRLATGVRAKRRGAREE
jgi:hypothetical protein